MAARFVIWILVVLGFLAMAPEALARGSSRSRGGSVPVRGYFKKDGTYVQPHMRSAPDGNPWNNWTTAGNVNPYTGAGGTRWPTAGYPTYTAPVTTSVVTPLASTVPITSWAAPNLLYTTASLRSWAYLPATAATLRDANGQLPTHFKIGKSGRCYYFYEPHGAWIADFDGRWARVDASAETSAKALYARLLQRVAADDWVHAANIALDEDHYGMALRFAEEAGDKCPAVKLAGIRATVTELWGARVEAIRAVWATGDHAGAFAQASELVDEYEGTSLCERTKAWALAMWKQLDAQGARTEAAESGPPRGRASVSIPRTTGFDWLEVDVEAFAAGTGDGAEAAAKTPIELARRALGIEAAEAAGDLRPTLVFFHWRHDGDPARLEPEAKTSLHLCTKVLDHEASARWGLLFRCVQVDPTTSDPRLLAALGADGKSGMVVLDAATAKPLVRFDDVSTPGSFVRACQDAIARLPAAKQALDAALVEQAKALTAARAAAKADKLEDALAGYNGLLAAKVRVGPAYDAALLESTVVAEKLERARTKGAP